jgi:pilus assembly protein CpaE
MTLKGGSYERPLSALLICPDREIARQIARPSGDVRSFEILSELRSYPADQTLEMRVRQIQPEVVLLDMASDFDAASAVLRKLTQWQPPVHVVALHASNEAPTVIRCLRAGAIEFLHSPFSIDAQIEACSRIRRLIAPERQVQHENGRLVMFTSAKPGSGASTLAIQTAFALRRQTGQRVLLVDLDVMGGSVAFNLKVPAASSVVDAVARADQLDAGLLSSLVTGSHGVDVLPAPQEPPADLGDLSRLHDVLECARQVYDWVVIDLPAVFHKLSLFALSEADHAFVVSTAELSSLHLARRSILYLESLGFGRERFQLLVNRLGKKDEISQSDLAKILGSSVLAIYPNDYASLHRAIARAEPLPADSELGRSIGQFALKIVGRTPVESKAAGQVVESRPVLSEG